MGGKIDEFVCAVVRERLARADLRDLLYEKADSTPRLKEIQDEIASLQARVKQTEHDYDEDLIDASTRKRKIGKLTSKIMKLEDEREELMPRNASSGIISSPDPAKAFDALTDPAQISRVIDELCTVTLYPHKAGARVTAESMAEDVKIEWK